MSKPLALVIEDYEDQAFVFRTALEQAGFEAEVIMDGQDALQRLAEVTPSVILLDMHLPGVSGKDILKHIKADERLADTRIILATADAVLAESLGRESDLALVKPISFSQLSALAARLLPPD